MTRSEYCRLILPYRERFLPLSLYLGGRWAFLKLVLAGAGIALVLQDDGLSRTFGGFLIGYALGKTAAGVRAFLTSRQTWPHARELMNWDRVRQHADG